jgi:hypothetical protein
MTATRKNDLRPTPTPPSTFGTATTLCARANLQLSFLMANETAIVDAEDLKKRAETLRRFL